MSISSVAAPAAVPPAHHGPQPKASDARQDNDADDRAGVAAAPAPLPPGQGTRIDQLV